MRVGGVAAGCVALTLTGAGAPTMDGPAGSAEQDGFMTPLFGALMAWSEGYITAKNEVGRLRRHAGLNTTFMQRGRWLQLFCQANPGATFLAAVYRLREHLVAEGL